MDVIRRTQRLRSAIGILVGLHLRYLRSPRGDPQLEEARRLRAAICAIDKGQDKRLSLREFRDWCFGFFAFDWDDPMLVHRAALIYLLSDDPYQEFEVLYRSNAPGRPLVLIRRFFEFPDSDSLQECIEIAGHRVDFHIAATVPRWRLVWKFSADLW